MRTGFSCYLLASLLALTPAIPVQADDLPVIASSSGTISLEQEFQLGRTWARLLRGRAPEYGDPLIVNYIDGLLWQIAASSQLLDHRLELIVIDSPVLNAFAVPGGVVGINAGLLLGAKMRQSWLPLSPTSWRICLSATTLSNWRKAVVIHH